LSKKFSGQVEIVPCDIASSESVKKAFEIVSEKTKRIDRIFNNAGIHRFEDWVTLDKTDIDFIPVMYNVNAVGPLRVIQAALPLIHSGTVIINISSEAASLTDQTATISYAYAMSKTGMNMGARIMDNWLRPQGVRTIMIHPGRMRTGMQGAHSNIDPWETSAALMELLEHLDEIPEEQLFMDYKGNPMNW
jgi:NAD(P)-dependent dehydrogenase (short-subunit alcohol dehydrogenase family)